MRNAFSDLLYKSMASDDRVFLLYGDIGNNLFNKIKSDFPNRIENAGIAEASMVGIAAGLSQAGYTPVCYTINSFLYLKALEQIKLDLAYPSRSVVLVGTGGGLAYGNLGTSHHSVEDYGVLGAIPGLRLYSPADSTELSLSFGEALGANAPSYIRIGKKGEIPFPRNFPLVNNSESGLRLISQQAGSTLAIVSVGTIGGDLFSQLSLRPDIGPVDHYSLYRIRPWNSGAIRDQLNAYERVLVIEEHYALSGVASLILHSLSSGESTIRVHSAALPIEYFTGKGGRENIRHYSRLDPLSLVQRIAGLV